MNHKIIRLLRLNKPTGILLLFFPCAYSIILFSHNLEELIYYLKLFFIGSIIMRSAGCIINDIIDKDFDILVERTNTRPLASGEISVLEALLILFFLLTLGLIILIQLPIAAIKIAFYSIIPIITYPIIKRISFFPQIFLGFTFNIGSLVAAASILIELSLSSFILYIGCVFWTIGYDTVYGFMDIKDDKNLGIKSLSIKLEHNNFKLWLILFYSIFILFSYITLIMIKTSNISLLLCIPLIWLTLKVKNLDINSIQSCNRHFSDSIITGLMISVIFLLTILC